MPDTQTVIFVKKTILTDSQIKELPTSPVEVLPSPGVGKINAVLAAWLRFDFTGGIYTNVDPDYVDFSLHPTTDLSFLVKDTAASVNNIPFELDSTHNYQISSVATLTAGGYFINANAQDSYFEDMPLNATMTNGLGNLTGGNASNTVTVTIYYTIIEL